MSIQYPVLFMQISSLGADPEQDSCHQQTTASLYEGRKNEIAIMVISLMCQSQGILSESVEERTLWTVTVTDFLFYVLCFMFQLSCIFTCY